MVRFFQLWRLRRRRRLSRGQGTSSVHPVHYSQLPMLLTGALRSDVVLLQLSPPGVGWTTQHGRR